MSVSEPSIHVAVSPCRHFVRALAWWCSDVRGVSSCSSDISRRSARYTCARSNLVLVLYLRLQWWTSSIACIGQRMT